MRDMTAPNPANRHEHYYANTIDYTFEYLPDGWCTIWQRNKYGYKPFREFNAAMGIERALSDLEFVEPAPVGMMPLLV